MNITAIINQKGGVAKTTTSINLAAGLVKQGVKVLLIDLDPQANTTSGLGIQRENFKNTIGDVLEGRVPLQDAIVKTHIENLDVIPAHILLDSIEQQLVQEMFRESILHNALLSSDLKYDYCIIDCRPALGVLTVNAIYAADSFIVPCEVARYALDGFGALLGTVGKIKGKKLDLEKQAKILLTKVDKRTTVSIEWVLHELERYKSLLFKTRIGRSEAINQSQMASQTIYEYEAKSTGTKDYDELTAEFMEWKKR
jgi:chromosome partitioning protein